MNRKVKTIIHKLNRDMDILFLKAVKDIKKIDDSYAIYNNGNIYVNHFTNNGIKGENVYLYG